ncbi:MAG: sulfate reduction electron transfer complex DsrMKJOP subunit DsrO [Planctomycetota bacterium]|jgi:molybdopterin-containing oxidoreductase family iron-sulfur binding subunit
MSETRRSFLKSAGRAAAGIGCGFPLLSAGCGMEERFGDRDPELSQLAMVVDVGKCLNAEVRAACIGACNQAHSIPTTLEPPEEVKWIWSEKYEDAFPEQAHPFTADKLKEKPVLVLCNHCTRPPCVKVCPTQATWKRESDGIVMMDMHRCIGCRYCIAACPYGARSFNWRDPGDYVNPEDRHPTYPARSKGVVEKCNFCAERLREGQQPACVEAAGAVAKDNPEVKDALVFGRLSEEGAVRRALRENHTISRRTGLGTGPNVFYIV